MGDCPENTFHLLSLEGEEKGEGESVINGLTLILTFSLEGEGTGIFMIRVRAQAQGLLLGILKLLWYDSLKKDV